jgi:hypothetical protein
MKYKNLKHIIQILSVCLLSKIIMYEVDLYKWKSIDKNFSYRHYDLKKYENLSIKLQDNELFLYNYYQRLAVLSEWKKSDSIINKILEKRLTSKILIQKGDIQLQLCDTMDAIKNYKLASFIVPHSLTSKFKLMKIHYAVRDTLNGDFWANSILRERVKIRSPTTDTIQKIAHYFLTKKSK